MLRRPLSQAQLRAALVSSDEHSNLASGTWKLTTTYYEQKIVFCLRATGSGAWIWARSVPGILLDQEAGARLDQLWKKNKYGVLVGHLSLLKVLVMLGEDEKALRAELKRHWAGESEAAKRRAIANANLRIAQDLRSLIDSFAAHAALGGTTLPESVFRVNRQLLDTLTYADPRIAQAVAYTDAGSPRADD